MTNREYVIDFFTRKLQEADDEALECAYTDGIGRSGEIETICEACQRIYPKQCTAGHNKPCVMTHTEWCGLEVVYKRRFEE